MKPIIAVTAWIEENQLQLNRDYTECILQAGGIPFIIPYMHDPQDVNTVCRMSDGLLLTGGKDIDPSLYGEQPLRGLGALSPDRDALEQKVINCFLAQDKPVLAICRGHQILNAVAGGTLYQDIGIQYPNALLHRQDAPPHHLFHTVKPAPGSRIARIAALEQFRTNSFHHQAVKDVAPAFQATAWAEDGIIEAIESSKHTFVIGVQWHPENTTGVDAVSCRLFDAFINACRQEQ